MDKCKDLINKVREAIFIKISDRQVTKFNRLMGNRDRGMENSTQPVASRNQLQVPNNTNKWVINLPNTPLTQSQESILSKDPNYAAEPKMPHTILITSQPLKQLVRN